MDLAVTRVAASLVLEMRFVSFSSSRCSPQFRLEVLSHLVLRLLGASVDHRFHPELVPTEETPHVHTKGFQGVEHKRVLQAHPDPIAIESSLSLGRSANFCRRYREVSVGLSAS